MSLSRKSDGTESGKSYVIDVTVRDNFASLSQNGRGWLRQERRVTPSLTTFLKEREGEKERREKKKEGRKGERDTSDWSDFISKTSKNRVRNTRGDCWITDVVESPPTPRRSGSWPTTWRYGLCEDMTVQSQRYPGVKSTQVPPTYFDTQALSWHVYLWRYGKSKIAKDHVCTRGLDILLVLCSQLLSNSFKHSVIPDSSPHRCLTHIVSHNHYHHMCIGEDVVQHPSIGYTYTRFTHRALVCKL